MVFTLQGESLTIEEQNVHQASRLGVLSLAIMRNLLDTEVLFMLISTVEFNRNFTHHSSLKT